MSAKPQHDARIDDVANSEGCLLWYGRVWWQSLSDPELAKLV